jgi:hypothetical protein
MKKIKYENTEQSKNGCNFVIYVFKHNNKIITCCDLLFLGTLHAIQVHARDNEVSF